MKSVTYVFHLIPSMALIPAITLVAFCSSENDVVENKVISPAIFLDGINPDGALEYADLLNRKLIDELPKVDKSVEMCVANSYWKGLNSDYNLEIIPGLSQYYDAEYFHVDMIEFAESSILFNKWCSDKTNGRIRDIRDAKDALALVL